MNVTHVQNNNQSFGMAFKLKGNGAKKLAEEFHRYKQPQKAKEFFLESVANPINKLKSIVIYDGEKVVVSNKDLGLTFEVLDTNHGVLRPFSDGNSYKVLGFHVKKGEADTTSVYKVYYNEKQSRLSSELALSEGNDCALRCAREIAKDMDKQAEKVAQTKAEALAMQTSIANDETQLLNLFG